MPLHNINSHISFNLYNRRASLSWHKTESSLKDVETISAFSLMPNVCIINPNQNQREKSADEWN